MPALTFLVKPASGDCNLRCRYCFYYNTHTVPGHVQRMSLETLERLIQEACETSPFQVGFGWQGGEPTLAGLAFFQEAVRLQRKYRRTGQRITNALQTNGLLLTPEWCEFLRENDFLVGLSLDGERERHDAERFDAGGHGTYDRVVQALRLLQQHKVRHNVLTVVTADIARRGRQTYRALRELGADYIQFIPSIDSGQGDVPRELLLTPEAYGAFLKNVYDEWVKELKAGKPVGVQFFESIAAMAVGQPSITCQMAGTCAGQLVVEHDGSLYPCDFMVREEWRLGNLHETPVREVLQGERLKAYMSWAVRLPDDCRSCEFLSFCKGGCPHHRSMHGGDPSRPDYFCRGYKMLFRHALPELAQLGRAAVARR
ncbi:MAG: anaerobic sulfatase maturase [Bacillota bacterium]